MSEAPERIWIEDEFGEGDDDQWTYGTWDVRNYAGYNVEYVRADTVQALTAERDEALNQLDSARHSVEVLEKRVAKFMADAQQNPWPPNLFHLTGDTLGLRCATANCGQHVSTRFESDGVGSDYCEPCGRKKAQET